MNKLVLLILSVFLLLPMNTSWAVEADVSNDITTQVETEIIDGVSSATEEVIEATSNDDVYKEPIAKKKLFKKFFAAMGGVVISSLALFIILSLYNRAREKFLNPVKTTEGETSLESPEDLNSAVKTFLDKTKWD